MNAQNLCDLINGKRTGGRWESVVVPRIVCADGFSLSVQASSMHYCAPREDDQKFYSTVEVGYPSAPVEELMPYADDASEPTETVYAYVPTEVVAQIIYRHGGAA